MLNNEEERILVLAGNYAQFCQYRKSLINSEAVKCIYVNNERNLCGLRNIKVIKTGTWWLNPVSESRRFLLLLGSKNAKNIHEK